jgi:hypothetical protein
MKRREFIAGLGSAAAWPLAARAQRGERVRRVGVLMGSAEDDPEYKIRVAAFRQGIERLGWSEGHNLHIDVRYAPAFSAEQAQGLAREIIVLQPDVIFAQGTPMVAAIWHAGNGAFTTLLGPGVLRGFLYGPPMVPAAPSSAGERDGLPIDQPPGSSNGDHQIDGKPRRSPFQCILGQDRLP